MTVVWSARALAHLSALRAYIARDNPTAAAEVAEIILSAAGRLARFPGLGRPGRVTGTREWVVPGTPFVIPYRVHGNRVEVIAVFHSRQRWPENV